MHITQFRMTNIGRFKSLEVPLWSAENPSYNLRVRPDIKMFAQIINGALNRLLFGI
jgi:hypothetical protein